MNKLTHWFIIGTFVLLYFIVSVISTIHVIDFFKLSNPNWLAISLAIAFEIGAAASLSSLIILKKMNRGLVWTLFIVLTLVQAMGNTYYAFSHLRDYNGWIELFNLIELEPIAQKRILAIISGAILPLVALGFIKSLVDYIKPESETTMPDVNASIINNNENKDYNIKNDIIDNADTNTITEMEKEVDRLLPYKNDSERQVIKEKIKNKMLELVNKEKEHLVKEELHDNIENISDELNNIQEDLNDTDFVNLDNEILEDYNEVNISDDVKKPYNKKRPAKKNEKPNHYTGGAT